MKYNISGLTNNKNIVEIEQKSLFLKNILVAVTETLIPLTCPTQFG